MPYTYQTEFHRWRTKPTFEEQSLIITFTHYRSFESLPDHGKALENFVDKAWSALHTYLQENNIEDGKGFTSWCGGYKYTEVKKTKNRA